MNRKYLSPRMYLRKARLIVARYLLEHGIRLERTTRVGGYSIRFTATSFLEYFLRGEECYKREMVTMHWIHNHIGQDDIVFDIGANVGSFSLLIGMKLARGKGKLYAFEPESSNFCSLNNNIKLNDLSKNITAYPIAFGDASRVSKLFVQSGEPGGSLNGIDQPKSERGIFEPVHSHGVFVMTVDQFVTEPGVKIPKTSYFDD